jgi:hypothetical protein
MPNALVALLLCRRSFSVHCDSLQHDRSNTPFFGAYVEGTGGGLLGGLLAWLLEWRLMDRAVYESTSRSIDPNCKKHPKGSLSEPLNL